MSDRTSSSPLYLSKSRYLSGLKCDRQLWLDAHGRDRATPPNDSQAHIFQMGVEVGEAARRLFPGGVLVRAAYQQHAVAMEQTRMLMGDPNVPAIFEAAFAHETVRIRVDVLERGEEGRWGLREVKSSSRVKRESHLPDLAIQRWVLVGCGLEVDSAELVHINGQYERGEGEIDWSEFFLRTELRDELDLTPPEVIASRVDRMRETLLVEDAPIREPGAFCKRPGLCRYWKDCTSGVAETPGASAGRNSKRARAKSGARSAVPTGNAVREVETRSEKGLWVSPHLAAALSRIKGPVWALDFEAIGPAIPLYAGARAYQPIAFQWSLHRLAETGEVEHFEFLADGRIDPRPEVAEALIERLGGDSGSILAYSAYEARCIADMAARCPELADPLFAIAKRLVDMLPIVQKHVDHPEFKGSSSMKVVGPALAGAVAYEDLDGVADGLSALAAFAGIVQGRFSGTEEERIRAELLAYCKLDTRALLGVYQTLAREADFRSRSH